MTDQSIEQMHSFTFLDFKLTLLTKDIDWKITLLGYV